MLEETLTVFITITSRLQPDKKASTAPKNGLERIIEETKGIMRSVKGMIRCFNFSFELLISSSLQSIDYQKTID